MMMVMTMIKTILITKIAVSRYRTSIFVFRSMWVYLGVIVGEYMSVPPFFYLQKHLPKWMKHPGKEWVYVYGFNADNLCCFISDVVQVKGSKLDLFLFKICTGKKEYLKRNVEFLLLLLLPPLLLLLPLLIIIIMTNKILSVPNPN